MLSEPANFLELLEPERIDQDVFRGTSYDIGFVRLFGGQVLGQGMMAVVDTVEPDRQVHSLHAYFLRPGDALAPVLYQVTRTRDGRSFSTRHVQALQNDRPIFDMTVSFHVPEEGRFEHQDAMPQDIPGPESLQSLRELYSENPAMPDFLSDRIGKERPVEMRPVNGAEMIDPEPAEALRYSWFRVKERLPDETHWHQAALAYASDFELLGTALMPHGISFIQREILSASLDHAIWFHRPFRADEWLLYRMSSPIMSSARGLLRGEIFNQDGLLVASIMQESLIRYLPGSE